MAVALALGCAPSSRPAVAARAAQPDWATAALGAPADVVLVARFAELLRNQHYGPLVQASLRAAAESDAGRRDLSRQVAPFASVERLETYFVLDAGPGATPSEGVRTVSVLRGAPPLEPTAFVDRAGTPDWRFSRAFPSGVREFAPNPNARGIWAFVLPGRTWVLADAATAARVAPILWGAPEPPPPSFFEPDALVAIYVGRGPIERARQRGWIATDAAVDGAILALRDGASGGLALRVGFPDEGGAAAGEEKTRALLAKPDRRREAPWVSSFDSVEVERDGAWVTMRATPSKEALEQIAAMAKRGLSSAPPPAPAPAPPVAPPPPERATPPTLPPLPAALTCDGEPKRLAVASHPPKPGPPPLEGQMTEQAVLAKRLFEAEKWREAIVALGRVARGETGDDAGNVQAAEYRLAVAHHLAKQYVESYSAFRPIANNTGHLKHLEALSWITKIAAERPDLVQLDDLVHYKKDLIARYDNPNQQQTYGAAAYLVGRARLGVGAWSDARELLGLVPGEHPYARYARQCLAFARRKP